MEGNLLRKKTGRKNWVVETITKPLRYLESSTTTIVTAEEVAAHLRSQQVSIVTIQIETFSTKLSEMISMNILKHVHPLIIRLFPGDLSITPLAVRLPHYSNEWKTLAKDQEILSVVNGYKIPFLTIPHQVKTPVSVHMTETYTQAIENKIKDLLEKGATRMEEDTSEEFLSNA